MITAFQFDNLWLAVVLWGVVYSCDYYLTIVGARLRIKYAQPYVAYEGSYELNPSFQRDVDNLQVISPKFLVFMVIYIGWLLSLWFTSLWFKIPELFTAGVGFVLLPELIVISQHIQNITFFNYLKEPDSVEGHIKYFRWVNVGLLASNFRNWTVLFFVLFCLTGNWLFVGGVISSLEIFIRFNRMSKKIRIKNSKSVAVSSGSV